MAKKPVIGYSDMTRKQKLLNFLKIFGLSFAGVAAVVAGVVIYVWATGGFNPPYVPLTEWAFSAAEYVIDGNSEISLDENGNQEKDENGNLVWKQLADEDGNPIYEAIKIVPNEGCTELDAVLTIDFSSNPNSPILQVIEDDNVSIVDKDEEVEDKLYYKYNVKINSPIHLRPLKTTFELNGEQVETNIGGWVKLTATQGLKTTSCWVFVDSPILDFNIELNQDAEFDEDEFVYNVYPGSELSVKSLVTPTTAAILPSSNIPSQKGTTSFTDKKSIYYQTSNPEIAAIDKNGVITIAEDKQGESFSVTAYIISKYNSIKDYTEDPSIDPLLPYIKDFDRTRVWSNTINFKIKPISVKSLTTGTNKIIEKPYEVFENGILSYSNAVSSNTKNSFFVDLTLSNETEAQYKYALMKNIKVFVGYEGDIVSEPAEKVLSVDDFAINGHKIVDAATSDALKNYITLTKLTDNSFEYTINQYLQEKFYFIFYYEMMSEDGSLSEILYDYIQFNITKTDLSNLQLLSSKDGEIVSTINITYNQNDEDRPYDLTKIYVDMTPAKPTYSYMLYFVPENNDIIETDSSIKIDIAGQDFVAVAANTDDGYDYTKIVATGTGKTKIYAVVLVTLEEYKGSSFGGYFLDTDKLLINNGYANFELRSESVNVTITNTVTFENLSIDEASSESLSRIQPDLDITDEAYTFAQGCDVYVEVYVGGEIAMDIAYNGTTDALENNRLLIELISSDLNITSISNIDNSQNGAYKFSILSNSVGKSKYQITHDENLCYTIGVNVLSTELVGMTLSAENSELSVSFDAQKATTYTWDNLELNLQYNSEKTDTKDFELRTYAVPDGFDISLLNNFVGRNYLEEISQLPNEINSIEKFINRLSIDDTIIKIFNTDTTDGDANVKIGELNYRYQFVGIGPVLVVAQSTSSAICSNPILIETNYPQISVVMQNGNDITNNLQQTDVYTYGDLISIDSSDNVPVPQEIQLLGNGQKQIYFYASVGDVEYDISELMRFKFENQNSSFVSLASGAEILQVGTPILSLAAINKNISENIIAYTDFGYVNSQFYKYNLIPDYKVINTKSSSVYSTPTYVDLFAGSASTLPAVIFTNANYDANSLLANDLSSLSVVDGNKLYISEDFNGGIDELKQFLPEDFLETFHYPDYAEADEYYHIYKVISIVDDGAYGADYEVDGTRILLAYSTSATKIITFKTNGGYIQKISITVQPGVAESFDYNQKNKRIERVADLTGNEMDLLSHINFNTQDNFAASLYDIDFAVTQITNENLTFYSNLQTNDMWVETFSQVLPENIKYITKDEFDLLNADEQSKYKQFYIQTFDNSNSGEHYEMVYSDETYYVAQTHFEEIPSQNLSIKYKAKYYEALFTLTTDTEVVDGVEYYTLKPNGAYVLVTSPTSDEINTYYVQTGEFQITSDEELLSGKKYYYKKNYIEVEDGKDISNVYEKVRVVMHLTRDSNNLISGVVLSYDENVLSEIVDPINLNFALTTYISNTQNNAETYYDGFYYNLSFEQ